MTKISTKALNPAIACFAVATIAAVSAFVFHHVFDVRLGWLNPLAFVGLLAGGAFGLALPESRKLLDRDTRLGFAFCIFVGVVGLIRLVA